MTRRRLAVLVAAVVLVLVQLACSTPGDRFLGAWEACVSQHGVEACQAKINTHQSKRH